MIDYLHIAGFLFGGYLIGLAMGFYIGNREVDRAKANYVRLYCIICKSLNRMDKISR